jgi:hypothetical protein
MNNESHAHEVEQSEVSFIGDCLRITSSFEVKDGNEKRRVNTDGEPKTFGKNNGKLAFVNEGGLMYVTTYSPDKVRELELLGYRNTSMGVPLSNNETPADSDDFSKWKRIVEDKID